MLAAAQVPEINAMRIWVDADACPNPIKEILFRAAERTRIELTLVANKPLRTPPSAYINTIQVEAGFDVGSTRAASVTPQTILKRVFPCGVSWMNCVRAAWTPAVRRHSARQTARHSRGNWNSSSRNLLPNRRRGAHNHTYPLIQGHAIG
jgi:hypothetical protein